MTPTAYSAQKKQVDSKPPLTNSGSGLIDPSPYKFVIIKYFLKS